LDQVRCTKEKLRVYKLGAKHNSWGIGAVRQANVIRSGRR